MQDLLTNSGNMRTWQELMIRYPTLSFSKYLSLRSVISAIPHDWISLCKSGEYVETKGKCVVALTDTGIIELSEIISNKVMNH